LLTILAISTKARKCLLKTCLIPVNITKAFRKLQENAKALNANAVVGIKIDIEPLANSYTLIVSITGTAVTVA
jgi:hypothetical protein